MTSNNALDEALHEHGQCKADLTDYKAKYEELYKEVQALKASAPSTAEEVSDKVSTASENRVFQTKLGKIEKEITQNNNALNTLGERWDHAMELIYNYSCRLDHIEQYSRLYSLLILGLTNIPTGFEDKGLVFSDWVAKQINKLLPNLPEKITVQHIDVSHPLPTRSSTAKSCIIVKFCRRDIRNMLFYKKRELKGTGVSFSEHLTPANLELYKEAQKLEGATTWTSQCKIFVKFGEGNKKMISCMRDIDLLRQQVTYPHDIPSEEKQSHDVPYTNTVSSKDFISYPASFPMLSNQNINPKRGAAYSGRGRSRGNSGLRGTRGSPRGYVCKHGY